jgi:hypothetical protein
MSVHDDIAPSTLPVELLDAGIRVEYLDGRTTLYRGVPATVDGTLTAPPGKQVHVLVTDPEGSEGVMVYVNDRKTHDDILESTGVGRVVLDGGETAELFPGVTVGSPDGMRCRIEADPGVAGGRVFAFVEDDWGEDSYELIESGGSDGDAD